MLEDETPNDPGVIRLVLGQAGTQEISGSGHALDRGRHPVVDGVRSKKTTKLIIESFYFEKPPNINIDTVNESLRNKCDYRT